MMLPVFSETLLMFVTRKRHSCSMKNNVRLELPGKAKFRKEGKFYRLCSFAEFISAYITLYLNSIILKIARNIPCKNICPAFQICFLLVSVDSILSNKYVSYVATRLFSQGC